MAPPSALPPHLSIDGERVQLAPPQIQKRVQDRLSATAHRGDLPTPPVPRRAQGGTRTVGSTRRTDPIQRFGRASLGFKSSGMSAAGFGRRGGNTMALTTKRVAKLTEAGRYGDGHGLYLQVTPAGVRSWLLRYERAGRERWMGLGPLHTFTLEEARARARQARQQIADGIDPLDARKAERAQRA